MRTILHPARLGYTAQMRILLLPPAYAGPEDLVAAGFVTDVRERQMDVDLVLAEPNLQHLTDRTLLRRLRHELVMPARAVGCDSVWICGISLGGFMGLAYAERFMGEVDGLCLIAPYLGNHMVTGEIRRANGVDDWQPGDLAQDDDERRVWRYIKAQRTRPVPMYLGFGSEDRFVDSHRMMAAALSPERVHTVPGGHDWPVWRQLWQRFLDERMAADAARHSNAATGHG
ncbi:MAG TPA: hypothetical protein VMT29_17655 [Steroidobacteraceae bacterium]|nr:hypothetical protein [Steroidobacteraceae bacterium]